MYKAVLFDLDGTLADSLESIAYGANKALEAKGFSPHPVENYKYYAGDGADMLIKRALKDAGDEAGEFFDETFSLYQDIFKEDCTYKVKAFDGIFELLEELKARGIKIGVISNKPHLRSVDVVNTLFGEDYFDIVVGQKEGVPKKPDPASTLDGARQLGVLPRECIYAGDTDVDMQNGNAAGMFTVGVLWGFRKREELLENHAHAIIETPRELINLL